MSATAFLVGALRTESGERRPREDVATYYRCTVLVAGVFAGASFFALLTAAVGIASYVALDAVANSAPPLPPCWEERRLGDAAAGQPQRQQGHHDHGSPAYGSSKTMLELFEDEAA
ncbi:hypothetical protein E2562_036618 [Oryza meyeriana var. granulata]|uniref:Uncharacterized protein n=1 Tax=Oryza meyeriana var. granulata TaxID=110450 RepID=A0A6G1BQ12_9ORYZ|nr:hypothetical protein E2562_036618 [Oryza meyeriana var. granulata]